MNIVGADYLTSSIDAGGYFIKAILNERGIHFIPHAVEHRDASLPGISYKDDSQGTALAATLKSGRMDIRTHQDFSVERVTRIVQQLLLRPELRSLADCCIVYDGQIVNSGMSS